MAGTSTPYPRRAGRPAAHPSPPAQRRSRRRLHRDTSGDHLAFPTIRTLTLRPGAPSALPESAAPRRLAAVDARHKDRSSAGRRRTWPSPRRDRLMSRTLRAYAAVARAHPPAGPAAGYSLGSRQSGARIHPDQEKLASVARRQGPAAAARSVRLVQEPTERETHDVLTC
jgi:hypothetical protein